MKNLLILLPFWEGDKIQAMELARLLADLEDMPTGVDFLFVSRFDCEQDKETLEYVGKKFNVRSYQSLSPVTGWPAACNSIFFDALDVIPRSRYEVILKLGADVAPLKKNWLKILFAAWENSRGFVAGALVEADGREHINGDCILLSGDPIFLEWLAAERTKTPETSGWEWWLNEDLKRWGWTNFPFVKSMWRKETLTEEEWASLHASDVAVVHGVKDFSLLSLSRKKLL